MVDKKNLMELIKVQADWKHDAVLLYPTVSLSICPNAGQKLATLTRK